MARNISVKVPVDKLIQQIEGKIAEIDKADEEYPAKREQYERDYKAYQNKVVEFALDYINKNADLVSHNYDSVVRINSFSRYNSRLEIVLDTDSIANFPQSPEEPERPNQKSYFGRDYTTQKSLLEKNLRILKMTTQEEVNASTYGAIMEIL